MIAAIDDLKHKEHLLAEKARDILEHQQELRALKDQKADLQYRKPATKKERLSFEESIEFGKQMERYEDELNRLELQIQKLTRELTALELQAKKLVPVSGVKIKVSTYPSDGSPSQTFCIQYLELETEDRLQSEGHFKVKRL